MTQGSDIRLKKNIAPINNSLSDLQKIKAYTYHWLDTKKDSTQQIGLLAQEVQKIYPQLVREDDKGMLSINYSGFVPLIIRGMQEQEVKIEELKIQNITLELRLKAIEALLSKK